MSLEPVAALKHGLDRALPGAEWILRAPPGGPAPRYLGQDACYPLKKILASCLALARDVDCLLVPRLVGPEGHLMCPNFRALPDLVALNCDRMPGHGDADRVFPLVDRFDRRGLEAIAGEAAARIRDRRGVPLETRPARGGSPDPGGKAPPPDDLSDRIALLGHPYVLDDRRLNNGVVEILHGRGVRTVRGDRIPYPECDRLARGRDWFAKTLYWRPAREMLGAFLYFTRVRRPAGIIHLVPFNCGIEALTRLELKAMHRAMGDPPPYMVVVCDEHTQQDHVSTRVEAFLDVAYGF